MNKTKFPCSSMRLPAGRGVDGERLRGNAERCYCLARAINHPEAECVLLALAREYEALADDTEKAR